MGVVVVALVVEEALVVVGVVELEAVGVAEVEPVVVGVVVPGVVGAVVVEPVVVFGAVAEAVAEDAGQELEDVVEVEELVA